MTDDHKAGGNKGEAARAKRLRENYAIIGELVTGATTLDFLLNHVLIRVLDLGDSKFIEPVVATLDTVRKIEMLRGRAAHITNPDWKKGINKFCDKVDSVFKQRNIACHVPALTDDEGGISFKPVAAAKLLKAIDLASKTARAHPIGDFQTAIRTAEAALSEGTNLIENFERVNAESTRRIAGS